MALLDQLKSRLSSIAGPAPQPATTDPQPGLYHYRKEAPGEQARLHLRIDPDGRGVLMVNASRVYHLNPSAATMAYYSLEGLEESQALAALQKKYHAGKAQLRGDYAQTMRQLEGLIHPDGACPVHDLELETTLP